MKLSRRSFFTVAAFGAFGSLAAVKLGKPRQQTKRKTTAAGYELSAHARKYYRTAKI
jgi:hypothetical protein